jgi:hypothetical protein
MKARLVHLTFLIKLIKRSVTLHNQRAASVRGLEKAVNFHTLTMGDHKTRSPHPLLRIAQETHRYSQEFHSQVGEMLLLDLKARQKQMSCHGTISSFCITI